MNREQAKDYLGNDNGTSIELADLSSKLKTEAISLRDAAKQLYEEYGMGCNCDLDNWQPERQTGHSHVCRIHQTVMRLKRDVNNSN